VVQDVETIDVRPGQYFGLENAPCLALKPLKSAIFSMTHLQRDAEDGATFTVDLPAEPGYFLMLYLEDAYHCDVAADGTHSPLVHYRSGSICLVDLVEGASICLHSRLDALAFTLPQGLFEELSDIAPDAAPQNLQCRRGELDAVMCKLGVALLPLLEQSASQIPPALQHIAIAICAHLLHTYSGVSRRDDSRKTTLSLSEEKAAKAFMVDHLNHDIRVAAIAAAIGLSAGHFSQGFKQATGSTPHQWLIHLRVERAKELLGQRDRTLVTIAKDCGFTDQSHFTKVFHRETGLTPAAWRSRGLQ
jgi:AraC family transcriptional regulator